MVRRLLACKADPNAALKAPILQRQHTAGDATLGKGATPFMRAAKSGDVEVMKLLLAAGADPKATLKNTTALMFAAGFGWRDGSPAAPSYDQGSPEEATQAIAMLLDLGLDINAANDNGDTVLHMAVTGRGSPEIVRFLLAHGANLQAQNKRGSDAARGRQGEPQATRAADRHPPHRRDRRPLRQIVCSGPSPSATGDCAIVALPREWPSGFWSVTQTPFANEVVY